MMIGIFSVKVKGIVRVIQVEDIDKLNSTVEAGSVINRFAEDYGRENVAMLNLLDLEATYTFSEVMTEKFVMGRPQ